jgi:hypothetical protein
VAGQGRLEMKSKAGQVSMGDNPLSGNEQVCMEIQIFLQALDSYPKRFARNPGITFEEYCSVLVQTAKIDSGSQA